MQLVRAVLLACTRTTDADRMRRYRECLQAYISQLPILYPGLECESIHHMVFHIYDFLEVSVCLQCGGYDALIMNMR